MLMVTLFNAALLQLWCYGWLLFGYVCLKLLTDIALCNIYALSRIPLPYDSACFDLLRICWTILDFVAHFLWLRCTKIQQVWTLYATTFVNGQRNLSTLVYVHCQCPTITTQKSVFSFVPGSQHDATHYLLLSAGECRRYRPLAGTRRRRTQLSIDISCPQGA